MPAEGPRGGRYWMELRAASPSSLVSAVNRTALRVGRSCASARTS